MSRLTGTQDKILNGTAWDGASLSVRAEPVNIVYQGEWKILSNLSYTPFQLGGQNFNSVEAFVQAIKLPPCEKRGRIQALHGFPAQRAGKNPNKKIAATKLAGGVPKVYWQGREIDYCSGEHLRLIESAIRQKFHSSEEARQALLATGDRPIVHVTGRPTRAITSLTPQSFCEILERIRGELRTGTFTAL